MNIYRYMLVVLLIMGSSIARSQDFPSGFIGDWQGELEWYSAGKNEPRKVKMQLLISPRETTGVFNWQLVYGEKNDDIRPYLLKPVDTAKGHWVIDEGNGILLDHYWLGNRLSAAFTVQQSTIINNFRLEGESMIVEFYALSAKPVSTSGKGTEEVPSVNSYAVRTYQKAILKKKKA